MIKLKTEAAAIQESLKIILHYFAESSSCNFAPELTSFVKTD